MINIGSWYRHMPCLLATSHDIFVIATCFPFIVVCVFVIGTWPFCYRHMLVSILAQEYTGRARCSTLKWPLRCGLSQYVLLLLIHDLFVNGTCPLELRGIDNLATFLSYSLVSSRHYLQAPHGGKQIFFGIDGKRRILIVSFLSCIQENSWAGNYLMGWRLLFHRQHLVLGAPVNYNFN